jgi:hypothetical protein
LTSVECRAAQAAWSRPADEPGSLVLDPTVPLVSLQSCRFSQSFGPRRWCMDCAPANRGFSLGQGSALPQPRSGPDLWRSCHAPIARAMGIRDKPTAPASPWQNGCAERLIGSIRRECLVRGRSWLDFPVVSRERGGWIEAVAKAREAVHAATVGRATKTTGKPMYQPCIRRRDDHQAACERPAL